MSSNTTNDVDDFVQTEPADNGSGFDVICFTQEGDPRVILRNRDEQSAAAMAHAIASALRTWDGWH